MASEEELKRAIRKRRISEEDKSRLERELIPHSGEEIHSIVSKKKKK